MRVVPDTNTLVSGLIWRGPSRQVLDAGFEAGWRFFTSPVLLLELERVLRYDRLQRAIAQSGQTPEVLFGLARSLLEAREVAVLMTPVSRDADDDHVLACARGVNANLIVSGDKDLLVLGQFEGIPIVTAARAVELTRVV